MSAPGKNRLTVALLTLVIWMSATVGVGVLFRPGVATSLPEIIRGLSSGVAVNIVIDIVILAVATVVFRFRDLGFTWPDGWALLRLMWFPLLTLAPFPLLAWAIGFPPGRAVAFLLLNTFLIAVSEEWMFRGILFRALSARLRLWPAILLTSVLFGSVHVLNAFTFGDLRMALAQSLAAMMTGLLLIALMLRTGSIWTAVAYHMAWNFGIVLVAYERAYELPPVGPLPLASYLVPLLIVLPNALYALVLLRKIGRDTACGTLFNKG